MTISEKLQKITFYLALLMELVVVIIDKSNLTNPYVSWCFRITFLLTAATVLLTNYTKREYAWILAFLVLGVISYKVTGRNEIIRLVVFVAACKDLDLKKVLKTMFFVTTGGCLLLMFLSVTGIYGRLLLETVSRIGETDLGRYSLGLGHPNALQCMALMLTMLGLYLYDEKMTWWKYVLVMAGNFGLFILTDSHIGFGLTALGILLSAAMHDWTGTASAKAAKREPAAKATQPAGIAGAWKRFQTSKLPYLLGVLAVLFNTGFSVWAAANSKDCWKDWMLVDKIDHKLNGRIVALYWGTETHEGAVDTWHLFGSRLSEEFFDMGIVRMFYWYGVIPAAIAIVLLIVLLIECYQRKNAQALVLIIVLTTYTVLEAHLVSVYLGRNYLLPILGAYWMHMLRADQGEETGLRKLYERKQ